MATQLGPYLIKGTLSNITFYMREGKPLARLKSSLTAGKVKTHPAFEGSRKASARFAIAASIAGKVYRELPKEIRIHGLIGKLTGEANKCLQAGLSEQDTYISLLKKNNPC